MYSSHDKNVLPKLYKKGVSVKRLATLSGLSYSEVCALVGEPDFAKMVAWRAQGRELVRYRVRHRDKFTCRDCGKKWKEGQRHFDVHHLGGLCGKKSRGYDKREDMNTLVTLCHKCHYNRPEHTTKKLSTGGGNLTLYTPHFGV